jgi:hypothetical protein
LLLKLIEGIWRYRQSFLVVGDPVSSDVTVFVKIQVQNTSFRSISRDELRSKSSDEFFRILHKGLGEAINSKVNGSQTLNSGIVSEDADIGSGPESRNLTNQFHIVSFDEDYVSLEFE